jgi:hypothetical protein
VELEAVEHVLEIHRAQVLSDPRATGSRLGLLILCASVPLWVQSPERIDHLDHRCAEEAATR